MRVALVSREVYPYIGGGIAPIVTATARLLCGIAEVTLVTSGDHAAEHAKLRAAGDPRLVPDDVKLVFVEEPTPEEVGGFYSFMHAWSSRVHDALREHYADRGPDLLEFCDYLGEGFVTVQAAHTRAPWLRDTLVCVRLHTTAEIVSVLDGRMPDDFATVAIYEAERYVLRHADRVLWSGGDVLATYRRFYGDSALAPGERIPDAFLVDSPMDPGREGGPADDQPVRMLYLGRLERRKGVQNLMRAVLGLPRDDWRLTLLGGDTSTGPLQTSMRAQLELMAADDPRVTFAEPVPRSQVGDFIRGHDLIVMPSLWECWPNVAREALMHNRPVLGTPVGGLAEMIVAGVSGWLARDAGADALADAIDARLDDPAEVTELIASGGPRTVFKRLTDSQRIVQGYTTLLAEDPPRTARRSLRAPPLVSIVVPYFQLEAVVEQTLESIQSQTYDAIETLVVNDGSLRDKDAAFLERVERLPVRVLTQVNSGLGAARNFGVSQSRGAYVLPLDADDLIDPTFVERCVSVLEEARELAYVTTWVQYMDPAGESLAGEGNGYFPFGNWSRLIDRNNVGGTCTALVRRRVFDLGYRYSVDLTSYEDWFLYREMHRAGLLGAVIPERLFRYRVRHESMMREIGSRHVGLIFDEMRAHQHERDVVWTADGLTALVD